MLSTGRPPFATSPSRRRKVEALAATRASHAEIATTIGTTRPTLTKHFRAELEAGQQAWRAAPVIWQTPMDYMMSVMNDNRASVVRRDRMAIALLRYMYGGPAIGKKEQQRLDAQNIGGGWGELVNPRQ